jgi:hypothetical protein
MREAEGTKKRRRTAMRWIRWCFLCWAVFSTLWLANSMRTRGVDATLLQSDAAVAVEDGPTTLDFVPVNPISRRP